MLKNYLKIAWRNLWKNSTFSVINILGLSVGVSCFLLISLYVLDELSYDKYNTHADRIYRVDYNLKFGDFAYNGTEAPAILGPVFSNDHPQIEEYVRFRPFRDFVVKKGDENLIENGGVFADSSLFDVFSLQMIVGNKETALKHPGSVVIAKTAAEKYFNTIDAVGKTLVVNDNNYTVTGVINDIPVQSHFHFDLYFAMAGAENSRDKDWLNNNFQTYLLLKPQTDVAVLEKQLNKTLIANTSQEFQGVLNMSKEEFEKAGNSISIGLRPLMGIHLYSNLTDELEANGNIQYVYIYSAIAVFILLLACVNFMNLSTARSAQRAKEVGVRQVLGSMRTSLITQFLSESIIVSLISFSVSIIIVFLALPYFNQLAGKQMSVQALMLPRMVFFLLLLMLIVGLIAGSYPAFFLSDFKPVQVLKNSVQRGGRGSLTRNVLVVFQFSVSLILMIGTVVIFNQLNYIRDTNLGFDKDQVLVLQKTFAVNTKAFRQELLKINGVKSVTVSDFLPVKGARRQRAYVTSPVFDGHKFTLMQQWAVDENYIPTLQIRVKKGRNFSSTFSSDSNAVLINEAAAALLAGQEPVNQNLYRIEDLKTGKLVPFKIIGVIANFNYNSLHEKVTPLVLNLEPANAGMAVKISSSNVPELLNRVKSKWKEMAPSQPFIYSFLDDDFQNQYKSEQRTGTISTVFSALAILIACLGLFGLITYDTEQRTKEIGIRKVLGASVSSIVLQFTKGFAHLFIIAFVVSVPIGWYTSQEWLRAFAYRIHLSWWMFGLPGIVALFLASIAIGYQSIKASSVNPIKSLRTE